MAKRRITRKQLKQKDEFQTKAEKLSVWLLEQGWKKVLGIIAIFGLFLLLVIFVQSLTGKKNMEASTLYGSALNTFLEANAGPATEFVQNEEKIKEAAKGFDNIASEYGSTIFGEMAAYYKVLCHFKLNEPEKGLEAGKKLFEDSSEDIVKNLIGFFLYDRYVKEENYEEARKVIDELKSDMNSMLNPNELYYKSGMLFEKEGKIDEATEEYFAIMDNEEFSVYKQEAQQRLNIINPVALKEKFQQK